MTAVETVRYGGFRPGDPVRLADGREGFVLSTWLDVHRGEDVSVDLRDGSRLVRVRHSTLTRRA